MGVMASKSSTHIRPFTGTFSTCSRLTNMWSPEEENPSILPRSCCADTHCMGITTSCPAWSRPGFSQPSTLDPGENTTAPHASPVGRDAFSLISPLHTPLQGTLWSPTRTLAASAIASSCGSLEPVCRLNSSSHNIAILHSRDPFVERSCKDKEPRKPPQPQPGRGSGNWTESPLQYSTWNSWLRPAATRASALVCATGRNLDHRCNRNSPRPDRSPGAAPLRLLVQFCRRGRPTLFTLGITIENSWECITHAQ